MGKGSKNQRKKINGQDHDHQDDHSGPVFSAKTQVVFDKFLEGHDEKLPCIKVVLKGLWRNLCVQKNLVGVA